MNAEYTADERPYVMSPLETLINALENAGLISKNDINAVRSSTIISNDAIDERRFLEELRRRALLTEYQTLEIAAGQADRLVIGTYVLLDCIGRGGMGQVFRARHRLMKREVAIKFVLAPRCESSEAIARFRREVETAGKLDHPRIVRALDAGERDGAWYLVMEYIPGISLRDLVKKDGPLSITQALNFVQQIADALLYAHRNGVIHRDIKPSNVLYCRDTNELKVLDMGLASCSQETSLEDSEITDYPITHLGQILGTVDYMAPEQFSDATSAGPQADIYSLGCTFHYLLTGRPPYGGDDPLQRAINHRQQPIPDLRTARKDVTDSVQQLFEWMLAKDYRRRCPDALSLIRELNQFNSVTAEHRGTQYSQDTTVQLPAAPAGVRRNKGMLATLLLGVLCGLAATVFWWNRTPEIAAVPLPLPDSNESREINEIQKFLATGSVNLLNVIQPDTDTVIGTPWDLDEQGLTTSTDAGAKLVIPHPLPSTYQLTMNVERLIGDGPLVVGLVIHDHHCVVLIDRRGVWGIGFVNQRMAAVTTDETLDVETSYELTFEVDGKSIRVLKDGQRVTEWAGNYNDLTAGGGWHAPANPNLFLGTNNNACFRFTSLVVEALDKLNAQL